jgi:coenzyme F420-reducing hydrogenase beta subunit
MSTPGTLADVIAGDYCVGCGACSFAAGAEAVPMRFDSLGRHIAAPGADPPPVAAVCPFSGQGPDEDAIAARLYPDLPVHPEIGRHALTAAGWVEGGDFRAAGSSGGLTSWVAARLVETGAVDAVLHVVPVDEPAPDEPLFAYAVSGTPDAVRAGAKSRYHSVEMSQVLRFVADGPEQRYALVGVPCFVKAVRLLQQRDAVLARRIAFTIALFCGHLKSRAFAELLAWQAGIAPPALAAIDFRHKLPDRPASRYAFAAAGRAGQSVVRPMSETLGGDWGEGQFKLNACDYCDDVVGETADIAIGDAWLPGWVEDSRGTNVVIVRHPALVRLIEAGEASGALVLTGIDPDAVAQSQRAGLSHRRQGLAWRLHRKAERGEWAPPKRVPPSNDLPDNRRRIFAARLEIARESHAAFADARGAGDLDRYRRRMAPLLARYHALYRPGLKQRLGAKVRKLLGR